MEIAFDESFGALFCDAEFEFAAKVAASPDDVDVFGFEVSAVDEKAPAFGGKRGAMGEKAGAIFFACW